MATMSRPPFSMTGMIPCSVANSEGTCAITSSATLPLERSTKGIPSALASAL